MVEIQLLDRLKEIYRKMAHAAMRAGREPSKVKLIAVTKTVDIDIIGKAVDAGMREFAAFSTLSTLLIPLNWQRRSTPRPAESTRSRRCLFR
jgi:hypothetical protein